MMMITFISLCLFVKVNCWLPDTASKLTLGEDRLTTTTFAANGNGNGSHFVVLLQTEHSILLGGRNAVYNLSAFDLSERNESRIAWSSSEAHTQLCILKGKSPEEECQNYIRIFAVTAPNTFLLCGTNSFKPQCRYYDQRGQVQREFEGIGVCPYDPRHNSTALYTNGQLFSATVADFSGGDPLIYREPQRTELSDLYQLNAPNFVSSLPFDEYIYFFFRETAVEFINCGKVIYSRVARVCKDDKGGPHQFRDRWTSFLKARLNCSMPGEYPFYFDEIQSTSDIVEASFGNTSTRGTSTSTSSKVIYAVLTTSTNAIGGSAICMYDMRQIVAAFEGSFKHQQSINSNWLPLAGDKVPVPRPGMCTRDSRILPETNVNFVKTHALMESAVGAMFGRPLLVRVSLQYRFSAIAVDAQIAAVADDGQVHDVVYVGTDHGKVLKVVNIVYAEEDGSQQVKSVVISETSLMSEAVTQLRLVTGYGRLLVVGRNQVKLVHLLHCSDAKSCRECVALQDPHCAWDLKHDACVALDRTTTVKQYLVQGISNGSSERCSLASPALSAPTANLIPDVARLPADVDDCDNSLDLDSNCLPKAVKQQPLQPLIIYTAETLQMWVVIVAALCLIVGFATGFFFSRRYHPQTLPSPFIEQHNQLEGRNQHFLSARPNKQVNLNMHVNIPPPPLKTDNLDQAANANANANKDLNIATDGTLQKKIKKTYI